MSFNKKSGTGFVERYFQIFGLALPAFAQLATEPLVSLVDTYFVSSQGTVALAALGASSAILGALFWTFNFLSTGTGPLVGRALGESRQERVDALISTAMSVSAALGVIAGLSLFIFAEEAVFLFGSKAETVVDAVTYLRIRSLGGPAVLVLVALNGVTRGFQNTTLPFYIAVVMTTANIALDAFFVSGLGLGIAGIAWASVIAQYVGCILLFSFVWGMRKFDFSWRRPNFEVLRSFFSVSAAIVLRTVALLFTLTLGASLVAREGAVAMASHQVVMQFWLLLAYFLDGLAVAAQALISSFLGQARFKEARQIAFDTWILSLIVGGILGLLIYLLRFDLLSVFTLAKEPAALVSELMLLLVLMQPLNALAFTSDGLCFATGDVFYLAKTMILSAALATVVFFSWGGIWGVWLGYSLQNITRAVVLGLRFVSKDGPFFKVVDSVERA